MNFNESKLQRDCIKWFRCQYPKLMLFSIPNGGKRGKIEAMIMKGEGVVSGVADLMLLKSNYKFHGLFIEMKYGKNKQTDLQLSFEKYCKENNYEYIVCKSIDEFIKQIKTYLHEI